MKVRKIASVLLTMLLLPATGCTTAQTAVQIQPAPAFAPLQVTLRDQAGTPHEVVLRAEDEARFTMQDPSCAGEAGDSIRSGHYRFAIVSAGTELAQTAAPFGEEILEFNEQRPGMLDVLPGEAGRAPDLLAVRQYASCNGSLVALLALSADGKTLNVVRFQSADGPKDTLQAGAFERLSVDRFQSTFYRNDTGQQEQKSWKWDLQENLFKEE